MVVPRPETAYLVISKNRPIRTDRDKEKNEKHCKITHNKLEVSEIVLSRSSIAENLNLLYSVFSEHDFGSPGA